MRAARGNRSALAFALALALCSAPLRAGAQAGEPAPPPEYTSLVEQALVESAASRWPEALALFRQAHAAYPNARTHRGIGMVAYEVRDYVEALRHLTLSLRSTRRPLDATQRAEVEKLLERTRAFVGRYQLNALPPAATLSVDGKRAEREADGTLVLALGAHRVEVGASGPERRGSAELQVKGGENEPLPVVLKEVAPATAAVAAPPVPAATAVAPDAPPAVPEAALSDPASPEIPDEPIEPRESEPTGGGSSALPLALTLGGGAMIVGGAVLLVIGLGDKGDVDDAKMNTPWTELEAANDRAPLFTGLGIGLLGAGGALAITGAVLWGMSGEDGDDDGELDGLSLRMRACF